MKDGIHRSNSIHIYEGLGKRIVFKQKGPPKRFVGQTLLSSTKDWVRGLGKEIKPAKKVRQKGSQVKHCFFGGKTSFGVNWRIDKEDRVFSEDWVRRIG